MMEVVMLVEEVLGITVGNEELTHLRTLGEARRSIAAAVAAAGSAGAKGFEFPIPAATPALSSVPARANQLKDSTRPLTRLPDGQVTPA